ncbi:protein-disulfide reductase DsbD [Pseudomonas eucalypticola]|uniref:Thiol:disulfide interchange protein DsbD n=1 Tax=Pseudomonas eucalypticola TaxID=2599595 RepID=A0A7D5H996_9PSED|nr:protein-disulfide reductase DsbD [Pseudomonas eucalypticola]QKZ07389.1 protein-disulfide reductase DsbD [Pseudomonas eucalypticola]
MRLLTLCFLMLYSALAAAVFGPPQAAFLPAEKAFVLTHQRLASGEHLLDWRIAPGYYLYKERMAFGGLPASQQPVLPDGVEHEDEFFGVQPIYRDQLQVLLPAEASGLVQLKWQGCADAGLCYPPQAFTLDLGGTANPAPGGEAEDQSIARDLQQRSLLWSMAAFFGLGLLLAFTPCSLPMLPILAGVVVGSGARTGRSLMLAGSYVLSMALVYAAMGVLAALLGANLQAWLQHPVLLASFAGLFVLLALPMFGVFELQLPAAVRDRLEQAGTRHKGGSLAGAGLMGLFSGLLIGPCMTAPLAGALLYIGQSGNALHGALVLFAMGVGIGLPLMLLVTVGNRFLPRPGAWMNLVKGVFGALFLGLALWIVEPLLDPVLWLALAGLLTLAMAIVCGCKLGTPLLRTGLGAPLGLWAVLMLVGAAAGGASPLQPLAVFAGTASAGIAPETAPAKVSSVADLERELQQAAAQGQWTLLHYTADWCVNCKVLEREILHHPVALQVLQGVRVLAVDVTQDNDQSRALLARHGVVGPPTMVWLGPDGQERREYRVTGLIKRDVFIQRWATAKERG